MVLLHGTEVRVSRALVGSKEALQLGDGPIHVSPAMYELMTHATPDQLETLLATIKVRRLPGQRPFDPAAALR